MSWAGRHVCAAFVALCDYQSERRSLREDSMTLQRLLIALTVFNLALLVFLLAQVEVRFLGFRFLRTVEVNSAGAVLRGRGLEITDEAGRVRASIKIHPASAMPDGTTYPEIVLLRLIDSQGRPNVKLAAAEDGSVLTLGGESDPAYIQLAARGAAMSVKLTNKDGQQQTIEP
jgi:hypothetical protein